MAVDNVPCNSADSAREAPVRRVVETLWGPSHRELATTVERFGLADNADHVTAQTEFLRDRLDTDDYHTRVAADDDDEVGIGIASSDADFVGFVATSRDGPPAGFDRPDRLVIADLYGRYKTGVSGSYGNRRLP